MHCGSISGLNYRTPGGVSSRAQTESILAAFIRRSICQGYLTTTRIWHVPAKHANRMDARAHSSSLAECALRFMTRGTHGFVDQSSPNLAHV